MLDGPLRRHHVPLRAARRLRRRRREDPGASTSRATSTRSAAPSAGSRPATTTWPRTSSTSCSPASKARRPARKGLSLFIVPKIWVNDDGIARRAERRRHRLDRAQARHQGVGDRGAELRRERRLPRHPRRRPAARGHEADVPHDERRAHRRRRPGPRGGVDGVPERARATRASGCRARRSGTSRIRTRRASPSSSTPTSAACCSR